MPIRMTSADALAAGIITTAQATPPPAPGTHEHWAASYSDDLLESIIADLGARNLRDQRDHEVRFMAERMKACRAERRRRKGGSR